MSNYRKFVKTEHTLLEQAPGRHHHWYFHPDISQQADTFLVKVVVPEGGGHPFHRHPEMNEILYILKGTAEQWVEEEKQFLQAGDSVYIAADVIHATFNGGAGELEFLAVLTPATGWAAGTIDESGNPSYASLRPATDQRNQ